MPLLKLILENPLITNINRHTLTKNTETFLSKNIQTMMLKIKCKKKNEMKHKGYEVIQNPNLISTLDAIEEKLSRYKYAEIISDPEIDTNIYITYKDPLKKSHKIPLLFYVSDYIDFLYCAYSYLII